MKPADLRPGTDQVPQADAKYTGSSRSVSLDPPTSAARHPDVAVITHGNPNASTSTFSLSESTSLSDPLSASASLPSLSTDARGGSLSPYMFSGSSRPPDSPIEPADDVEEEDRTDGGSTEREEQAAAAQAEGGSIVVDSDDLGTDDGYGTDNNTTASTSLAESVRDYIYENGRRYHRFREGRYNFPNDDVEYVDSVRAQ